MSDNRDYTSYSFRITFLVIAILLVVSLVPPFSIGSVHFKRTNILSDIITFEDAVADREGELSEDDLRFIEEAEKKELELSAPQEEPATPTGSEEWDLGTGEAKTTAGAADVDVSDIDPNGVVRFMDHTAEGRVSVADFSRMMAEASKNRVVRVAFLGDSYIEGDIITADVRAQLQDMYGGEGVGFVAMGNPLAISRPTVTHTFGGWSNYNLIYKKKTPEEYSDRFYVSGTISVPKDGEAWSLYKGAGFRKHLSSWSRAKIIFYNPGDAVIDVAVNDSIKRRFTPGPGEGVQQITLNGAGMRSLRVEVSEGEGFVGYGVVMEAPRGVSVDNYSIRSNSGLAMFGTDSKTNQEINRMLGYDLIVLQWGLNAMDPSVTNYTNYGTQLRRVINYMKSCFPRAAIVLMGVGDRATQKEGEFVTMDAVRAMIKVQKAAAEECGVAFWNTFQAMGGDNSMSRYVENNWAAKDYTHLSYGGGRQIATKFVEALRYASTEEGTANGSGFGGDRTDRTGESALIDVRAAVGDGEQEGGDVLPEEMNDEADSLNGADVRQDDGAAVEAVSGVEQDVTGTAQEDSVERQGAVGDADTLGGVREVAPPVQDSLAAGREEAGVAEREEQENE